MEHTLQVVLLSPSSELKGIVAAHDAERLTALAGGGMDTVRGENLGNGTEAEFAEMDGWNAESDAAELLSNLGIKEADHYRLMEELAEKGVAILFVSSEMEEILSMSDRVFVMHEGQITGELPREKMSEESIMMLATGNAISVNA